VSQQFIKEVGMKINELLSEHKNYSDYIVYSKKSEKVLYVGHSSETAKSFESKKTKTLEPLKKHTITKEKIKHYLSQPSCYSF